MKTTILLPKRIAVPEPKPVTNVADIKSLRVTFTRPDCAEFDVVDDVSFSVKAGEIVGVVGESGSGKSISAKAIMGLVARNAQVTGDIRVAGRDVLALTDEELRALRGTRVSMVFQDPMTSFNPVRTIGDQIGEAVTIHRRLRGRKLKEFVVALLAQVGIISPLERAKAYPHEFSGGMRQRALIAMSVANSPDLLIADEPTTALDVTVQDQVLDLMCELNEKQGTAIILITHNIAIVASICHRVMVMYGGQIVEEGPIDAILENPQHPYTWMLLQSVPRIDRHVDRLTAIEGQPPDPANPPAGCKFQPRCPFAIERCTSERPALREVQSEHLARCFVMMKNCERNAHVK